MEAATALMAVGHDDSSGLPSLHDGRAALERLIANREANVIDEARRQAEAHQLYEQRSKNDERSVHFARLRLLAEAALGVLSFDEPGIVEGDTLRKSFQAAGAALERGQLLTLSDGLPLDRLTTAAFARHVHYSGWASVPGEALGMRGSVSWRRARIVASEQGLDFTALPCNQAMREALRQRQRAATRHHDRFRAAKLRLERAERAKVIRRIAKDKGPRLDAAYGLFRRMLQTLHDSQSELENDERRELGCIIDDLYDVQDRIAVMLGILPR